MSEEEKDDFCSIGDLLDNGYYNNARSITGSPELGQFVWLPVPESTPRPWIADVVRSAPRSHDSAELHIRPLDEGRDYKGKGDRLPVHALKLSNNHELMVAPSKKRLCLIVGQTAGVDPYSIPEGKQRNKALQAFVKQYLVVPLYSTSTPAKSTAFGSVMSARIRCLMYPAFFWLSRSGGIISQDSVARLDHAFLSPLVYGSQLENHFVTDEVLGIIHNQLKILINQSPDDEFLEIQNMLIEDLPEYLKLP